MNEEELEKHLKKQIATVNRTVDKMQRELKTFMVLKQVLIIGLVVSLLLGVVAIWTLLI